MRNGWRRKWWGVLACGTAIVFLAVSTAGADDKTLEELKARLDRLEKQNEDLRKQLDTVPTAAPYKAEDPPKDKDKEKERVNKLIDAYMKDKDKKQKEATDKKKQEEQEVGHEVGSLLGVTAKWDDYHLWFRTADNSFAFRLMGWAQWDDVNVDGPQRMFQPLASNGIGKFDNGVNTRRIRLNSSGTFYDQFDFMMEFEFGLAQRVAMPGNPVTVTSTGVPGATATGTISSQAGTVADRLNMVSAFAPTDLWGQIRDTPIGNIRIGNIRPMYSMENLQSSRFVDFLEFSYIWDAFTEQGFDGWIPSAVVWGNWGDLNGVKNRGFYGVSVGWSDNRELYPWNVADGNLMESARVGWTLFDECEGSKLLNISVGSMHQTANNGTLRYRSRFELRNGNIFEQNTLAAIQGGLSDAWLVQPELFFNWGAFTLQSEWAVLSAVQEQGSVFTQVGNQTTGLPSGSRGRLYYTGGYVAVGYFLTGESRAFDRTWKTADRVVPIENAFCRQDGCWNFGRGAWEVLARYNYLNMDSKGVNGGVLNGITLGVNWYLNPKMRFMVDYVMDHRGAVQYVNGSQTPTSDSVSGWLYGVGARIHFDF